MAKQIKNTDIFESNLFDEIIKDANEAVKIFNKLDSELLSVSKSFEKILKNANKVSKGGISELISSSDALNKITLETLKLEREKIKVQKTFDLTQSQRLSAEQSLQKQRERGIAQMQKEAKTVAEASRPYNQMSARLNQLRKDYKDLAIAGNENSTSARQMKREIDKLDSTLKKVDGSVGQFQRSVGNYKKGFDQITTSLAKIGLGFSVFEGIRSFGQTEIKLQSLQLALQNVMKTTDAYNKSFAFLTNLSRNYGQDLIVLTDTYKNFIASSESSGLVLEERNKIYESVIKAGSSLALSNDQIQGSLLAVSQMFSKGTVSAEELRGQLGERLPGAFGIMAKAVGVSEQELGKMMQKGQVLASDVLPKFAVELEKSFGANASKNLQTIGGAWNVLSTNISLYINDANKGGRATKSIAEAIGFLANNLDTIVAILKVAIRQYIIFKAVNSDFAKSLFSTKTAMDETAKSTNSFSASLKSIGWTTAIALASELALKLYDIVSGAEFARIELEHLNKATSKGTTEGRKIIESIQAQTKGNKELTKSLIEQRIERFKNARQLIVEERYRLQGELRGMSQVTSPIEYGKLQGQLLVVNGYLKENYAITNELYSAYKTVNTEIETNTKSTSKNTAETKKNTKERKDATEQINQLVESLANLDEFYSDNSLEQNAKQLEQALNFEMEKIAINGEYSVDVINKIIDAEKELQKVIIERQYQTDIANAKNTADYELAEAKRSKALQDLDENTIQKKKDTKKQLDIEQERHAENQYEKDKKRKDKQEEEDKDRLEKEKERLKEQREFRRQIANAIIDEMKRISEMRESQYDKDIQTQKDFQSQLQAQANAGNITAQQSIAQSIEAEKQATIAKQKEQKKQQQYDDIKTLYNLINQNIDKGDNAGIATVKATASMGLIKSIAKLFSGFAKGTKWKLGDEHAPLFSGIDGHVVRVDSNEAIVNAGLMTKAEKAGISSTEELVNSAVKYQNFNPNIIRMGDNRNAYNALLQIEPITQRLESMENTIKNKTEFRIDPYVINGIVQGVMTTEKSKNLTRTNILKG